MEPFNCVNDAIDWIVTHATGPVEVFIFDSSNVMAGAPHVEGYECSIIERGFMFW